MSSVNTASVINIYEVTGTKADRNADATTYTTAAQKKITLDEYAAKYEGRTVQLNTIRPKPDVELLALKF